MDLLMATGLPPGALVLLDSSSLAYLAAGEGRRAAAVRAFWEAAAAGEIRLAASCLAWTELLAGPLGGGEADLAARARSLLADSSRLVLHPVDVAVADLAAFLLGASARAGGKRLQTADAIHLATAFMVGADALLTNDGAWGGFAALAGRAEAPFQGPRRRPIPLVLLVDELAFET